MNDKAVAKRADGFIGYTFLIVRDLRTAVENSGGAWPITFAANRRCESSHLEASFPAVASAPRGGASRFAGCYTALCDGE
jgi:hypothetical protein